MLLPYQNAQTISILSLKTSCSVRLIFNVFCFVPKHLDSHHILTLYTSNHLLRQFHLSDFEKQALLEVLLKLAEDIW